jgi:hypothetical protein
MAQRLADEQIIELIGALKEEEKIGAMMSYQEFKAFLLAEEYGYVIEGIANKCPVSLKPNFIDFPM